MRFLFACYGYATGLIFSSSLIAEEKSVHPVPVDEARDTWRIAAEEVTAPDLISVPDGFAVELLRSAAEEEGSWIALAFDNKNGLFVAREDRGIIQFTVDPSGSLIEPREIDSELEECRGLLWAYDSLYVNSNQSNGLFRLIDQDQDGIFETKQKLLETTQGSPKNGRNQLRLGPDGLIYFMSGHDVFLTDKIDPQSPLRNYEEDQLIPNPWDEESFNKHALAPGGHLIRMDKDGKFFQLIAGGLRNAMDVAFHQSGEMFTYDADMEWDAALAWYKPTRVLHLVSGGDYGWRRGTGKFPDYYKDCVPPVLDLGLGSPTGLEFGYKSNYPEKWKNALFAADWTYGRIIAVHLTEKGSSFSGTSETFASGRPINVVDLTFGRDGNLYFVTGGMKTRSGIYRISWQGGLEESQTKVKEESPKVVSEELVLRTLRTQLEYFHVIRSDYGAQLALRWLDHEDEFVRNAARIALENQDPKLWVKTALSGDSPEGFIALARVGKVLPAGKLIDRLNKLNLAELDEKTLLGVLRAYHIELARNGKPGPRRVDTLIDNLNRIFPSQSGRLNYELCELLIYLEAPNLLTHICRFIESSETTEDLSQYLVFGRYINSDWSLESKRTFLKGVQRLESFPGRKYHQKTVEDLRSEMLARLSEPEKRALAKWIKPLSHGIEATPTEPVSFVNDWILDDFGPDLSGRLSGRDFNRGLVAYTKAGCVTCHKMKDNPGSSKAVAGPDLSTLGNRFSLRGILVSILDPSRVIADKYRNPAAPNLSTMPPALLNSLEYAEVVDLLAYLEAGGNRAASVFSGDRRKLLTEIVQSEAFTTDSLLQTGPQPIDLNLVPVETPFIENSYFKRMSAANYEDRKRLYDDIARILELHPGATFEFVGHADDSKYSQTNYDISLNRARFTMVNMIYRGLPKKVFTCRGVGDKEPSPHGNRRVEVHVQLMAAP